MFAAILGIVALSTEVSSLSIADKLHSPFSSDCFKRISIGQRLIHYDVTRTIDKNTVKGCEDECNIYECTFFSFGISPGGNGTCELSTSRLISKRQATDYDLYQRTKECSQGKPTGYEEVCYRRVVSGRRVDERFIRHSLPCDSLEACQHQCSIEKHFKCQGFNIRWTRQKPGGGICELSAVHTSYLDPARDFRYDPEFDYFERDQSNQSPNCGVINEVYGGPPKDNADQGGRPFQALPGGPYHGGDSYGPWSSGYGGPEHGPWGSHGYGSGSYMPNNPGRPPMPSYVPNHIAPGLYFKPGNQRPSYNFHTNEIPNYPRYGDKVGPYDPRMYYPDNRKYPMHPSPPPRKPTYVIIDSDRDRNMFGRENGVYGPKYPRPPVYGDRPPFIPDDRFHGVNTIGKEVCFQRAHVGFRVDPKYVKGFHMTPSVLECEAMCMQSPFKCTGYSYRYSNAGNPEPNCALTDFNHANPKHSLLPDRSCDFYVKMPTCSAAGRSEDTECFLKTFSNQRIAPDKIRRAVFVRGVSDCELECLKSYHFTCRSFTFRYGPGVIGEPAENCFLSDWPVRDLHPADYAPGPGCEVYERGSYGHGCELDTGPPSIGPSFTGIGYPAIHDKYEWNRQEMWRHFTVRGWPCRIGTQCQLNREAGFWSCEVEGGDRGQWDYCCKPGHHCGFSRGYYYPWCFVGEAGPDQWRPCSEQYFPDFGNRFSYRPEHAVRPHPDEHKGNGLWNYGQEEYGPPSYWPILYLYTEPPPNITESWIHDDPHHPPFYLQNYDDDPKIQFRPSKNKFSYPKGIVLKIDVKDKPPASDPGHEAHKDEHHSPHIYPRYNYRKNVDLVEKVPVNDLNYPHFVKHDCEKQNLKAEEDRVASSTTPSPSNYTNTKRELWSTEKSKEVIRDVEKIIEEKAKGPKEEDNVKNKTSTESYPTRGGNEENPRDWELPRR